MWYLYMCICTGVIIIIIIMPHMAWPLIVLVNPWKFLRHKMGTALSMLTTLIFISYIFDIYTHSPYLLYVIQRGWPLHLLFHVLQAIELGSTQLPRLAPFHSCFTPAPSHFIFQSPLICKTLIICRSPSKSIFPWTISAIRKKKITAGGRTIESD